MHRAFEYDGSFVPTAGDLDGQHVSFLMQRESNH
jgi:hypothetical protein